MGAHATHEDARLLLELYDLRREKRLRQARDFVQLELKFKDYKDFQKRYPEGSKQGNYVGMVTGYWEMACTLVAKGLIAEELFNATNFEHVAIWFKLKPIIEGWRKEYHYDEIMKNLETVATGHPAAAAFAPEPEKGKKKKAATKAKGNKAKGKKAKAAAKPAEPPKQARPAPDEDDEDEDRDVADLDDDDEEE